MSIWRRLRPDDMQGVIAVAEAVHPELPEDEAVLAERLALWPEGCFAFDGAGGLAGYLLSHPWRLGAPPKLNQPLGALPAVPDTYYIHDLALHPSAQGSGAAGTIMRRLLAQTAGWASHSLVAVNGSAPFWRHHGFRPAPGPLLSGYGAGATHMVREGSAAETAG